MQDLNKFKNEMNLSGKNVYVGHRYVPKMFGEWNNENIYEPLSIVQYQGTSYTSRQYVPVGIEITNEEYWVVTGNYNAQVEQYRQDVRNLDQAIIDASGGYGSLQDRLDKENENVLNRIEYIVNPDNFDTLDEALNHVRENSGSVLKTGYLLLNQDVDFRGIPLDIEYLDKGSHQITLGAFTNDPATRVKQRIGYISNVTHRERNKVYFKGASYATYEIGTYNGCIHFQLTDEKNGDDFVGTYMAYANFIFTNVADIEIDNAPVIDTEILDGRNLWFNENTFYLKNTYTFKMNGTYNHNNNIINGGCFEGNSEITLNVGSNNIFNDIRAESPNGGKNVTITFGNKANHNKVYLTTSMYTPTIIDNGVGNSVIRDKIKEMRLVNQFVKSKNDLITIDTTPRLILDKGFKNLQLTGSGYLTVTPSGTKTKTVIFESPFYENPENMTALLEVGLNGGLGYGLNYRLYNSAKEDITDTIYTEKGAFYGITTAATVIANGNEEVSLNPNYVDANTRFKITNGIKNDKVFIQPLYYRFNALSESEKPKYVKFEIQSDEAVSFNGGTMTSFNEITLSIYDISSNYHYRYFRN